MKLIILNCVVAEDLGRLDSLVFANISSAWSVNTINTRTSQWKRFFKFCVEYGLTPLPASSRTVARFLSDLGLTCKYTTVVNYLSAITTMHKFYGFDPEFRDSYYLSMAVSGIKMNLGSEVSQKIALTPTELIRMYVFVSMGDPFHMACWSAIIFSFRTLLRKSHFLPDSSSYTPHLLNRNQLTFFPGGMTVQVRTSKTDRSGGKPQRITVYETLQRPLCAVTWVKRHLDTTPDPESGLFVKLSGTRYVPLTYTDVLRYLQSLVGLIGYDPQDAGLHSLRRSGASYLNSIGVSLPDIKLIGNWKSSSVFDYIKCSDARLNDIQMSVANSLMQL